MGGAASVAHIHCCVPVGSNTGVAVGFTGFPAATSGAYFHVFDLTAEAALIAGLDGYMAYSNPMPLSREVKSVATLPPSRPSLLAPCS